jgi:hypothetical protein
VDDIFEKGIRSLEARMEERFDSLKGRLNLLGRKLLSMDTRVDNNLNGSFQRLNECINKSGEGINDIQSRKFKECNETGKRPVQIGDNWQKLAQRCYRRFAKLGVNSLSLRPLLHAHSGPDQSHLTLRTRVGGTFSTKALVVCWHRGQLF